jgi:hypothetical protein
MGSDFSTTGRPCSIRRRAPVSSTSLARALYQSRLVSQMGCSGCFLCTELIPQLSHCFAVVGANCSPF